jgi:hypothetical protein
LTASTYAGQQPWHLRLNGAADSFETGWQVTKYCAREFDPKEVTRSFPATIAFAALAWAVVQTVPTDVQALQYHVGTFQFSPEGGIKACRNRSRPSVLDRQGRADHLRPERAVRAA